MTSAVVTADATFTRPADTTAYASGDLVANSTTAGSVVPMSLTFSANSAKPFYIRRAHISKTTGTITVSNFRVHFYMGATPAATNGDNAVYACGTQATYLGFIDVSITQGMATGASTWGAAVFGAEPSGVPAIGTVTVFALFEARAAYVPGNAEVFTCRIEVDLLR